MSYRGRFAPSPSGPLHLGSLVAAFASWLDARAQDGEWLLRIEDLDPPREVAGAAQAQLRTLARFGLLADRPVLWQSDRHELYRAALEQLDAKGASFACSCTRRQLAAAGGAHRNCPAAADPARHAIRLRVADELVCFEDRVCGRCCEQAGRDCGDFVLRRADGLFAYQLAVVVDDAEQGITDIVRGADLLWSTPRQRLLQRALGLPHPRTLHLPLVLGADGQKLAKSHGAADLDGEDPLSVLRAVWQHLGQDPDVLGGRLTLEALRRAASRHWDVSRIRCQDLRPPGRPTDIDAV